MIQNKTHADRQVQGNLGGEDIKMGVADMAHIMNVLTDLYADRELACIREYSTNALDAHIEAGVNAPIEVTTPTHLAPFLTIRDYGIGLSLEDIRSIYSQYGASTKRGTNSQTGMLGLGCKSALTYADQFTVTSVKDGVRVQVVVSRNTMGASMKVVDTSDTDDPNGTTVTIPARSHNVIEVKARNFFRHWKKGTVKVNGVEPEFMPGVKWVSDTLAITDSHENYVVMGGVPYPAPGLNNGLGYGQSITAFVEIGAVDFAPSREGLMDTDTTTATLRRLEREFKDALTEAIRKDVENATSPRDAIQRRLDWLRKVPRQFIPASIKYKGKEVPSEQPVPDNTIIAPVYGRKMTSHSKMQRGIGMETVLNSMWIVGYDHVSFTATVKKKLMKYCEDAGITDVQHFILSKGEPSKDWIEGITFEKWETIKAIKLPRNAPNPTTGRIPGSYDLYEDGDYNEGVPGDDIDTSKPIFWMFGKYYEGRKVATHLNESYPGCTVVMLRRGREDKFKRLFPKSREAQAVIKDAFNAWSKSVSKDDRMAWVCQRNYQLSDLEYIDPSKVDDPAVKYACKVRNRDLTKIQAQAEKWSALGFYYSPEAEPLANPLNKYPLLPDGYSWRRMGARMDHIYRYMNNEFLYQTQQAAAAKP